MAHIDNIFVISHRLINRLRLIVEIGREQKVVGNLHLIFKAVVTIVVIATTLNTVACLIL